ncbi:MAG TPA: sulfur carrier protein ThiS [Polyangia bacterium]|jgi:sulfur carrier protein
MALTVNQDPHPFREGLTIAELLEEKRFLFPLKIVFVNEVLVKKEAWAQTVLHDGDVVQVVHMTGGG